MAGCVSLSGRAAPCDATIHAVGKPLAADPLLAPIVAVSGGLQRPSRAAALAEHLLDLIGLGTPGLTLRQAVPDNALLHYAALVGSQARSAEALEAILNGYFEVPVEVEQFAGAWYRLDPSAQCSMSDEDSDAEKLGTGAVVGDEIWDQQSRVGIRIGPLSLEQYTNFLPGGSAHEPLKALVKFFSNDELDFAVTLVLRRDQVPKCEVGGEDAAAPRLGWISWLKSAPLDHNPGDTILNL